MKTGNKRLHFEGFVLDLDRHLLEYQGREIPLRNKTYGVLRYLVEHRHRVVGKDELLAAVWPGVQIEPQGVFQSVSELRAAFGRRAFIRTVRGAGYQWVAVTGEYPPHGLAPSGLLRRRPWSGAALIATAFGALLILTVIGADPVGTPPATGALTSDALLERAREHLAGGTLDSAEQHLAIVLDRNPGHLEARLDLAYIQRERGDTEAARLLAEQVHADAIAHGTEYVRMASAALVGQLTETGGGRAESYAREAIHIAGRLGLPVFAAVGHERLGELYRDRGEPALAAGEWAKAIDQYRDACPDGVERVRGMLAALTRDS